LPFGPNRSRKTATLFINQAVSSLSDKFSATNTRRLSFSSIGASQISALSIPEVNSKLCLIVNPVGPSACLAASSNERHLRFPRPHLLRVLNHRPSQAVAALSPATMAGASMSRSRTGTSSLLLSPPSWAKYGAINSARRCASRNIFDCRRKRKRSCIWNRGR